MARTTLKIDAPPCRNLWVGAAGTLAPNVHAAILVGVESAFLEQVKLSPLHQRSEDIGAAAPAGSGLESE